MSLITKSNVNNQYDANADLEGKINAKEDVLVIGLPECKKHKIIESVAQKTGRILIKIQSSDLACMIEGCTPAWAYEITQNLDKNYLIFIDGLNMKPCTLPSVAIVQQFKQSYKFLMDSGSSLIKEHEICSKIKHFNFIVCATGDSPEEWPMCNPDEFKYREGLFDNIIEWE